jgi:hypothetical protein
MKKNLIRLTEGDLHRIIKESVKNVLKEAKDPTIVIQSLIQQANESFMQAKQYCEDEWPLMDKEGETYGLSSEIKLDGRGYVIIPFIGNRYGNYNGIEKIKVLQKRRGIVTVIKGDDFIEGWKDVKKLLNSIIKDSKRGIEYFKGFDPDWEESETKDEFKANRENLRQFNKQIGRKSNVGMEYLNKRY